MIDKASFGRHISRQFNKEIEDLREQIMTMGGMVEKALASAVEAIATGQAGDLSAIKEEDRKVNALEVLIDKTIAQMIAKRQPTASDLRLLLSASRVIVDLERTGDEAKKIYKMAKQLAGDRPEGAVPLAEAENLGRHVQTMLSEALGAHARLDADAALAVAREDKKVDREHEELLRLNLTYMLEDPRNIKRAVNLMWAARSLERIGDHARNICEHTIYMVTGEDVRYTPLGKVEKIVEEDSD